MAISLLDAGPSTVVAQPADLPYAMATLTPGSGMWSFSGIDQSEYEVGSPAYSGGAWHVLVTKDGVTDSAYSGLEDDDVLSLTFYADAFGFMFTATRPYANGATLLDRASNVISVPAPTILVLPVEIPGLLRDFLVKVTTSADNMYITWQGQGSEAPNGVDEIEFVTEDGNFPVVGEAGAYWFSFSEVSPHTFAVAMKPLVTAPQPTTQSAGGGT